MVSCRRWALHVDDAVVVVAFVDLAMSVLGRTVFQLFAVVLVLLLTLDRSWCCGGSGRYGDAGQ